MTTPTPALLRHLDADLDAVREIGPAGADVGAEHVGAVALVVEAAGDLRLRLAELRHVAEEIDRGAADRRQEQFEVGPRHQLGVHAAGLLEERAAQIDLGHAEALGDAGQPPHRLDRGLGHAHVAVPLQDVAVGLQAPRRHGVLDLRHVDVRLGDGDGRADVPARRQLVGEDRRPPDGPRDRATRSSSDRTSSRTGRSCSAGEVLVKSGRWSALSSCAAMASAR